MQGAIESQSNASDPLTKQQKLNHVPSDSVSKVKFVQIMRYFCVFSSPSVLVLCNFVSEEDLHLFSL